MSVNQLTERYQPDISLVSVWFFSRCDQVICKVRDIVLDKRFNFFGDHEQWSCKVKVRK